MSLSYLDVLLATAMVFVVLYGLAAQHSPLPEREGKAVVLCLHAPPAGERPTGGELEYRLGKTGDATGWTIDLSEKDSGKRNKPRTGKRAGAYLKILDVEESPATGMTVRVLGQPDPGAMLRFTLRRPVPTNAAELRLLELNRDRPRVERAIAELFRRARDGESLAVAAAWTGTESQKKRIAEWTDGLGDTTPEERADQHRAAVLSEKGYAGMTEGDVRTYAMFIERTLAGKSPGPVDPPERMMRSYQRVARHFWARWGAESPILEPLLNYSKSWPKEYREAMEAFREPRKDHVLKRCFPPSTLQDDAQWRSNLNELENRNPQGGPFLTADLAATKIAPPVRCYWSYAGESDVRLAEWSLSRGSAQASGTKEMETTVEVLFK